MPAYDYVRLVRGHDLQHGPRSPYAEFFDIDWEPLREPYVLSLGPYAFDWFRLVRPGAQETSYGIERTAL